MPNELIKIDHGAGGGMSQELIGDVIVKTLGEVYVGLMEDSADVPLDTARIAITTDSFVVDPLFFGNGDIGKIAVAGTVNDLAVSGAKPRYLTLALIIEEGFPISDLVRVLESVRATALEAGVLIVAGTPRSCAGVRRTGSTSTRPASVCTTVPSSGSARAASAPATA